MVKNSRFQILILIATLIVGILIGWTCSSPSEKLSSPVTVKEFLGSNKFINPVLFTETDKDIYKTYAALEEKLKSYIKIIDENHTVGSASVYFRDLNTAQWTGVNEEMKYHPGSMLKLAVVLGYLRAAESNPSILSKKLDYKTAIYHGQYYQPTDPLKSGWYSVKELINAMIIKSDNIATEILVENNPKDYEDIYKKFQLPLPSNDPNDTDFMSPKSYSTIWRALYNARYLSAPVSDEVLELLTKTSFDKGIVAGVSKGTLVAHKFGEHTNLYNGGDLVEHQLHDCGIVYYPDKPYFLCVMTKGPDFAKLEGVIANISKITYDFVKMN